VDLISALSGIQGALDITKGVLGGIKAVRETNAALKVLDFQEQVLEIKEQLLAAKEATTALIQENQELRSQLQLERELVHDENGNVLWRVVDERRSGPYCSTCYGGDGKEISLSGDRDDGSWNCPRCKNRFHTKEWKDQQDREHEQLASQRCRSLF